MDFKSLTQAIFESLNDCAKIINIMRDKPTLELANIYNIFQNISILMYISIAQNNEDICGSLFLYAKDESVKLFRHNILF